MTVVDEGCEERVYEERIGTSEQRGENAAVEWGQQNEVGVGREE